MEIDFLRQRANDHAQVAEEGLTEWNELILEKESEDLPGMLPGLFMIMNDILLAIHYDLQALLDKS